MNLSNTSHEIGITLRRRRDRRRAADLKTDMERDGRSLRKNRRPDTHLGFLFYNNHPHLPPLNLVCSIAYVKAPSSSHVAELHHRPPYRSTRSRSLPASRIMQVIPII